MARSKGGKYWYRKNDWEDFDKFAWNMISHSSRRKIMKHLIPKPEACPICGCPGHVEESGGYWSGPRERVLVLCNKSGTLQRDLNDWYWICRTCKSDIYKKEHRNPPHIHKKPQPVIKF